MISTIKNFVLNDHAPTQYFLYSIPVVNVFARAFQSNHSLDSIDSIDDTKIKNLEIKKINFQNHMNTAIKMQKIVFVAMLCLCLVLPRAALKLRINYICSYALALVVSNTLGDYCWRSFAPTMSKFQNNKWRDVTGW